MLGIVAESLDDRCPSVDTWCGSCFKWIYAAFIRGSGGLPLPSRRQLLQDLWFCGESS